MRAYAAALISLTVLAGQPALAQPPETVASPPVDEAAVFTGPICLTNSCGGKAYAFNPNPKSIREAIEGGNAQAVRALGGSPADALSALQARVAAQLAAAATPADADGRRQLASNFVAFGDTTDGSRLAFTDDTSFHIDNRTVVGSITRTDPNGRSQNVYLTSDGGAIWVGPSYALPPTPRG